MEAAQALSKAIVDIDLGFDLEYVLLRASQINGCGVCVDMHAKALRERGESEERVWSIAAWREPPYYTDAERAALELTEALTRIADSARGRQRRGLGRGPRALRRRAAAGADPRHRRHQPLEPHQRGDPPDRGRAAVS